MSKLAAIALFATALTSTAQMKVLVEKSRVPASVVFDDFRNFALPTLCDDQGRSYVKLVKAGAGMAGPLLWLSSTGVQEAQFDTTDTLENVYAVRPSGGVSMVRMEQAGALIGNFAPNGKRESSVRLERPPVPFFPLQIAVFRSGEILVSGLQYHPGYRASTAIYDPTGRLVKQFRLDGDAEIEHAIEAGDNRYARAPGGGNAPVSRSVVISADDGLVYLMRATSPAAVYAISAGGAVVRKVVVESPTGSGLPAAIRVAKNKLAVKFYRTCAVSLSSCQGTAYTVVDATTGERLADYEANQDLAGPIACYSPNPDRFFTFWITPELHRLQIVESAAR